MSEDLQNYKLQLQQVEAGLQTDPDNAELLKLKEDLVEVIELTKDLIRTQLEEQKKSAYIEPSTGASISEYYDEVEAALLEAEKLVTTTQKWKVGDKCQAKWLEDGKYYDATIEGIGADGEVNVVFDTYQNRATTTVTELRACTTRNEVFPSTSKRHHPNQKEYLKKRKQKKLQRVKELEEEREHDKKKWLNFTSKNIKKPGMKVKSIFSTPDTVSGRVGIGTCGVSGKGMTEFTVGEKYRSARK
ncbi:survival of motor neuron-related-splicing factor 30 [Ceratitis capitata]|uniref:Survival of motor neuron-related-splicing factor 30 n=1 Tax=Ceratitis capitata TaxID=7213 RepID=W8ARY5_CERCA|nr:survival of motor neuron-related-splicing factor 30 [Ceratitis capitata]